MQNLRRALRYFSPDAPRIALVCLLILGSTAAGLLKPWPLAIIVDSVLGGKQAPTWLVNLTSHPSKASLLLGLSIAAVLLHLAQGALSSAQNYLAIKIGLRGLRRVRNELFARLQTLSMRFHQGSRTGDLIYRATWDAYAFQTLFQQGFVTFLTSLLSLTLMVIIMCRLNVPLTLAALATVPLLLFSIKIFGRHMRERGVTAQKSDSLAASILQQVIAALPVIQSCTREADEEKKFTAQTALAQEQRLSQHGWEIIYALAITVAFSLGTGAIIWLGSRQVEAGKLTIGELLIFLAYLAQLYEPLNQLSHVGATVSNAGAGTQRVFEILDARDEIKDAPEARPVQSSRFQVQSLKKPDVDTRPATSATPTLVVRAPSPGVPCEAEETGLNKPLLIHGNITFDRVTFGYEPGQTVLNELTFQIAAGESLAIIGPSGAGKSTLLNLLPRFFDPREGALRVEGVDLRELRLKDLRSQIALVPQEPVLLPVSIAENIAYGRPDATSDEIAAAARAANAHDFIQKLPQGYGTIVGEGGSRLSVGERQRLNLARAFLKDAPILLLDEPTSALDRETEALVVASLQRLMKGRTTLIVAHRLTTIRSAHRVLVLNAGQIAELGEPRKLQEQGGYFAKILREA